MKLNDKLKGLYIVWSEIKHYYPYQDKLREIGWDSLVDEFVNPILKTESIRDYYFELMKFISYVNDGHTLVIPPWKYIVPNYSKPAIEVEIRNDIFRISRVGINDDLIENDIKLDDIIISIDDIPISRYFEEVNKLYARGTPQANEAINSFYLLMGPIDETIKLVIQRGKSNRTVNLKRDCTSNGEFFVDSIINVNPAYKINLENELLTVDIRAFEDDNLVADFVNIITSNKVSEIHFDLRNNLGGKDKIAYGLIEQIINEPLNGVKYKYLVSSKALQRWGYEDEWKISSRTIEPNNITGFNGKVKIIFNGATSSTAEDFVIAMSNRPNTVFEGLITAGSAGNPYTVELPFGGFLRVSTFIGLDSSGNEYVGKGFKPVK